MSINPLDDYDVENGWGKEEGGVEKGSWEIDRLSYDIIPHELPT